MSAGFETAESFRKWRFTWEAVSHIPFLRLVVFAPHINPSILCKKLKVNLNLEAFQLTLSWIEENEVSLKVPVPRVLVDVETPVNFMLFEDHIEVKLVLLLPVDHPIVLNFGTALTLTEDEVCHEESLIALDLQPLRIDSDVKSLSSMEGVHFHCKMCSTKLTKRLLRSFTEMPSVNWRESADSWFGACCCSFGGISEKLVNRYANSFICKDGKCLLDTASVTVSKDDLEGCKFPDLDVNKIPENETENMRSSEEKVRCIHHQEEIVHANLHCEVPETFVDNSLCSSHDVCIMPPTANESAENIKLQNNQISFLNGFLGSVFMARSSSLSKEVEWMEYRCPTCSSLLGACPCNATNHVPLDGGVRLFKCCISTCLPVGGPTDTFRQYSLEKMFASQLVESAKDELLFRIVVRDLKTKSLMLQVVLLNPNSWCCAGYCFGPSNPVLKLDLLPVIKVQYADGSEATDDQLRIMEEWVSKNQADEVYMLKHQIGELIQSLKLAQGTFPPSYSSLHGVPLSYIRR